MSDVSKTNELIAEARLAACSECSEEGTSPPMRCDGDLIRRLADALEAATRERDAAVAAIERVRAAIRQYPNYGARFAVEAALDGAPEPEVKP